MMGAYRLPAPAMAGRLGLSSTRALVALLGAVIERVMLRRAHANGHAHELIMTFGCSSYSRKLRKEVLRILPVEYSDPQVLDVYGFQRVRHRISVAIASSRRAVAIAFTDSSTCCCAFHARRTRGARGRASSADGGGASAHNAPTFVFSPSFALGAAMAGAAGTVRGRLYPTSRNGAGTSA